MQKRAHATFAGGCFWCLVPPFEQLPGVESITAGYIGGTTENPSYSEVCEGTTGHNEAVDIVFDPDQITYQELLDIFWRQIDPTDPGGQFADRGQSYKTAIFYHDQQQKLTAEQSKNEVSASGRFSAPIVTEVRAATPFYAAEAEHQSYHKKNPFHYNQYKQGSGRATFIARNWKD